MLHCLFFSCVSITFKLLLEQGFTVFQLITMETVVSLVCVVPWFLFKNRTPFDMAMLPLYLLRSVLWIVATATFFYATTRIPIPQAIAISFAVPLFNTIFATLILKEHVGYHRILAIITGFIGMMVIVQPGLDNFNSASLLVVFASLCWSLNDVIVKIMGKTQPVLLQSVTFLSVSVIMSTPLTYYYWVVPTLPQWALLLLIGFFFVLALVTLLNAYGGSDLSVLMPFYFLQLLFISVFAYVLFNEAIKPTTITGALIILSSATYIAYRERQKKRAIIIKPMI